MEPVDDALPIAEWLTVLRRRWWIVAVTTLLSALIASGLTLTKRPLYEAEALVLYPTRDESLFGGGTDLRAADAARAIQTEVQILKGEQVRDRLVEELRPGVRIPPPLVNAIGNTDVIAVRVQSHDRTSAQVVANGYARAYVDTRRSARAEQVATASTRFNETIELLLTRVEALPSESPLAPALIAQQAALQDTLLRMQVDAEVTAGGASILRSAALPDEPIAPTPVSTTALAGLVGLLIGLVGAFLIDRLDHRGHEGNTPRRALRPADSASSSDHEPLATPEAGEPLGATAVRV